MPASLVQAVYAAYGRPVLEALEAEEAAAATKPNTKPKGTVKPKAAVKPKAQTAASPHR